ncbi:Wadjet anti-phage system protein JetD domain-containing protein [Teredinibacter purpureus]|uniref:Wadjet anti-phage system protein JetD domain-containing protein n=1 Tax=Teredinibacter purpureus TaxID=2731756 RepID=UPI0005F7AD24|nr:Wadjet anti-phage system protein JetD domain-containing protein [Teredinibacter purpureus]
MNMDEPMLRSRPRWADEEPMIASLLDTFIHKLEKGQRLSLRVSSKTLPELFNFDTEEPQYLWTLIKSLNNEYHILSIRYARNKPYQEPYDNAQLVFNPDKEELVRHWLNRPALDPYALVWQDTLRKLHANFEDHGQTLYEQIIRLPDKGAEQTLHAFARLNKELQRSISLRALSARCFWGDSKFLDHREALVRSLFPAASHNLQPRPVLLNVCLPERFERIVFIENQDTFLALAQAQPPRIAFVYSAGFRGSATRIREQGNVAFSYLPNSHVASATAFEHWWCNATTPSTFNVQFWGDLDFAGIGILKSLKNTFPDVTAWKTGYQPLLERLLNRQGHAHESSGKERQKDPGLSGCEFADTKLLPAMRDLGEFIDQEAIIFSDLTLNRPY